MTIYLLCLEFRTPPFNVQFQYPNAQVSVPIVLDGAFSFSERFMDVDDWRKEYLIDAFNQIRHPIPKIQTSYMFPATQENQLVKCITPSNTRLTFRIGRKASLEKIFEKTSDKDKELPPFSLRLKREFDLAKVLNFIDSVNSLELCRKKGKIKGISTISERRGPYKSILLDLKIKASHLFWCTIVDTNDLKILEKYLEYLKISGIGKKRSMGWGDLKKFEIYELEQHNSIEIFADKIEYGQNHEKFIETIRPVQLKDIQKLIRDDKYMLIKSRFGQGAINPPYWGKETVVYWAKLRIG